MFLKKLRLENFRKFKEADFEFKPITILVGPNNSGKSSLIKALLLLRDNVVNKWQDIRFGTETNHRILSFAHALNDPQKEQFSIKCEYEFFRDVDEDGGFENSIDIVVKKSQNRIESNVNYVNHSIGQFETFLKYLPPYRGIGLNVYPKKRFPHFTKNLRYFEFAVDSENEKLIRKWISKNGFNISDDVLIEDRETDYKIDLIKNGNLADLSYLGTGSAQIFAIICEIAFSSQESIILEEPETNLHPNFQSKLADMILEGWHNEKTKRGPRNQFIIETHSEYLIRKFQYLVAKGEAKSEDIQIYYFSEDGKVSPLEIEKNGNLSGDFGTGFFDESPLLITDLWKAQRSKLN
jgi:predicted ATPase